MNRTVITIDNSKTMRDMIGFVLKQAGYDVVGVDDAGQAMSFLESEKHNVCCVVADMAMPVMNGIEFTKSLRATSLWESLPVVMLGMEGNDLKKQAARNAGVNHWLSKPVNPSKLVDAVYKACS